MKTTARIFVIIVSLLSTLSALAGDLQKLGENKQELEQIKKQFSDTQQKVDSLKRVESDLQKAISKYGERVNRNRTLVDKMERELRSIRGEISQNDSLLAFTDNRLKRKREGYAQLLVELYIERNASPGIDPWDFTGHMAQNRRRYYMTAISGSSTREINQVGDSLRILAQCIDSLRNQDTDLDHMRREKKAKINLDLTLKEKEETSLGSIQRQSNVLKDRLVSLSEVAREMEDIIARLEEAQRQRRQAQGETPRFSSESFAQFKGSLAPPIKGRVISTFGWKTDPNTNLKSFSPGIDIKPSAGLNNVSASVPGRVVYVGSLRGYSNFVILEHDDDYFTTYAGLSTVVVELDDLVSAGQRLGQRGEGNVHFEIRQGREHLDPVIWLDMNEF